MYICVDFDGTIVDHDFPNIGAPIPGAIDWLKRIHAAGGEIILWTMRSDDPGKNRDVLTQAVDYLTSQGIELFGINENPTQGWSSSPKAYGHLYIDDAAVGCPLMEVSGFKRLCVDWSVVGPQVESRLLQNKS